MPQDSWNASKLIGSKLESDRLPNWIGTEPIGTDMDPRHPGIGRNSMKTRNCGRDPVSKPGHRLGGTGGWPGGGAVGDVREEQEEPTQKEGEREAEEVTRGHGDSPLSPASPSAPLNDSAFRITSASYPISANGLDATGSVPIAVRILEDSLIIALKIWMILGRSGWIQRRSDASDAADAAQTPDATLYRKLCKYLIWMRFFVNCLSALGRRWRRWRRRRRHRRPAPTGGRIYPS